MSKFKSLPRMTIEFIYSDGRVESSCSDCNSIKARFYEFVNSAITTYLDGFREVRLLDSAGRVFKSYIQHF